MGRASFEARARRALVPSSNSTQFLGTLLELALGVVRDWIWVLNLSACMESAQTRVEHRALCLRRGGNSLAFKEGDTADAEPLERCAAIDLTGTRPCNI